MDRYEHKGGDRTFDCMPDVLADAKTEGTQVALAAVNLNHQRCGAHILYVWFVGMTCNLLAAM